MSEITHTWRILHRTDWGHRHDSLLPENAPVPEGDEQFRVIEVVPADAYREAVANLMCREQEIAALLEVLAPFLRLDYDIGDEWAGVCGAARDVHEGLSGPGETR